MLTFKEIFNSSFIENTDLIRGISKFDNIILSVESIDSNKEITEDTLILVCSDSLRDIGVIKEINDNKDISAVVFFGRENRDIIIKEVKKLPLVNKPMAFVPEEYTEENIKDNIEETRFFKYIYSNIKIKERKSITEYSALDDGILDLTMNLNKAIKKQVDIIDVIQDRTYTSQGRILKNSKETNDYLFSQEFKHDKIQIYNRINLVRYTSYHGKYKDKSWIVLSVKYDEVDMFHIVIWMNFIDEEFDVNDYKYLYTGYMYLFLQYGEKYLEDSFKRKKEEELIAQLLFEENIDREKVFYNLKTMLKYVQRSFVVISIVDMFKDNNYYNDNYYIVKETISIINNILGKKNVLVGLVSASNFVIIYNFEVSDFSKESFSLKIKEIISKMETERRQHRFKVGIGKFTDDIGRIKASYEQSKEAINFSEYVLDDSRVNYYEDLGIFSLIKFKDINDFIVESKNGRLKKLFSKEYEEILETLDVYMKSDYSYAAAAKKLYIHSNTLRYRISKIEKDLDIDLDDQNIRFNLVFILKFKNIINKDMR